MNRLNALCIEIEPWMIQEDYQEAMNTYGIEFTIGFEPRMKKRVIWLNKHDEQIFTMAQGDMNILYGLKLWYDDGEREIRINEGNYKQYDSALFYKDRTGVYDIDTQI